MEESCPVFFGQRHASPACLCHIVTQHVGRTLIRKNPTAPSLCTDLDSTAARYSILQHTANPHRATLQQNTQRATQHVLAGHTATYCNTRLLTQTHKRTLSLTHTYTHTHTHTHTHQLKCLPCSDYRGFAVVNVCACVCVRVCLCVRVRVYKHTTFRPDIGLYTTIYTRWARGARRWRAVARSCLAPTGPDQ